MAGVSKLFHRFRHPMIFYRNILHFLSLYINTLIIRICAGWNIDGPAHIFNLYIWILCDLHIDRTWYEFKIPIRHFHVEIHLIHLITDRQIGLLYRRGLACCRYLWSNISFI